MVNCMMRETPSPPRFIHGFTMIELIVVMAVIGLLLSLAVPRYLDSLERGKDQVQVHDLAQMRKAIDQFYGDRGTYPERLDDLVTYRYLRALPLNPHTDEVDWITVAPPNGQKGAVYDVQAPATANAGAVQPASNGQADEASTSASAPEQDTPR
jgi:general secretion pathway protein G